MIIIGILAAEVSFWVILGIALVFRYLIGWRRISTVLLALLPVVDLALLAFVIADLVRGAEPAQQHALAATYLGFTIAFGKPLVRWADGKFGRRITGQSAPARPAKGSSAWVRALWVEWFRVLAAVVIAVGILAVLALVIRHEPLPQSMEQASTNPFWSQSVTLGIVVVVWFLAGPAFARRKDDAG